MKLLKHKVQGYYININHQGNVKKIYFGKHTTKEEATLLASEYRVQQQRAKLGLVCSDCGKNIESKNQEEDIAIYELFNKFLDWLKQHHKNEGVKEEQHDTIKSFFYSEPLNIPVSNKSVESFSVFKTSGTSVYKALADKIYSGSWSPKY